MQWMVFRVVFATVFKLDMFENHHIVFSRVTVAFSRCFEYIPSVMHSYAKAYFGAKPSHLTRKMLPANVIRLFLDFHNAWVDCWWIWDRKRRCFSWYTSLLLLCSGWIHVYQLYLLLWILEVRLSPGERVLLSHHWIWLMIYVCVFCTLL